MELKPCPFCGNVRLLTTRNFPIAGDTAWVVKCEICEAMGPWRRGSADSAEEHWNQRGCPTDGAIPTGRSIGQKEE